MAFANPVIRNESSWVDQPGIEVDKTLPGTDKRLWPLRYALIWCFGLNYARESLLSFIPLISRDLMNFIEDRIVTRLVDSFKLKIIDINGTVEYRWAKFSAPEVTSWTRLSKNSSGTDSFSCRDRRYYFLNGVYKL